MTSSNIVKLDVGGTVFQTSRSTLTKYDCMFRGMLESDIPLQTDESGYVFIDRDPTHFRYILNFMRDGTVELPENPIEIREILKEAEFYLFQELIDFCMSHEFGFPIVRDSEEMEEVLKNAKNDLLVLIWPHQETDANVLTNHKLIKEFVDRNKEKIDIVIKIDADNADKWSLKFHEVARIDRIQPNHDHVALKKQYTNTTEFFKRAEGFLRFHHFRKIHRELMITLLQPALG